MGVYKNENIFGNGLTSGSPRAVRGIAVFLASLTILNCVWSPERVTSDSNKLVRIMYLYDYRECGYKLRKAKSIQNVLLNNESSNVNVIPIKWTPAVMTVSTRLSAKTRTYIEVSIGFHAIWMLFAILLWIFIKVKSIKLKYLKLNLNVFMYYSLFMVVFDISMAIVYVAHIQKSLTNGMVLRYSGWAVEIKLENYDMFAGWIPMVASACWLRGILIMVCNVYSIKKIRFIIHKIRKKEVKIKMAQEGYLPIPDPTLLGEDHSEILFCRTP
ncbi:uncharacterized protein LOC126371639 [Pectinophora gossypiella]|uniref:uncharacterized protein LOC126371639 n=1 Tax=Pectinophora gossypiella TaxID=13191 RepID=UPI00214F4546|nr:uncharacterized protein LOC126371639 [Pectinophora gossypiella]